MLLHLVVLTTFGIILWCLEVRNSNKAMNLFQGNSQDQVVQANLLQLKLVLSLLEDSHLVSRQSFLRRWAPQLALIFKFMDITRLVLSFKDVNLLAMEASGPKIKEQA